MTNERNVARGLRNQQKTGRPGQYGMNEWLAVTVGCRLGRQGTNHASRGRGTDGMASEVFVVKSCLVK
jgi:hypothetical protein